MGPIHLDAIELREPIPGFKGRFIHTSSMTFAFWEIEAGSVLPEHSHPHEQVVHLIEGEMVLTLDGHRNTLASGSLLVIPSNVPHSGRTVSASRVLDVFHPVREDYR